MVVKSKFGRRRYIVFKILEGEDINHKDLIYTFNRVLPNLPSELKKEVTGQNNSVDTKSKTQELRTSGLNAKQSMLKHRLKYFDGLFGILLCPHWLKTSAIETLNSLDRVGRMRKPVKFESLGTSGTLKSARKKYIE